MSRVICHCCERLMASPGYEFRGLNGEVYPVHFTCLPDYSLRFSQEQREELLMLYAVWTAWIRLRSY